MAGQKIAKTTERFIEVAVLARIRRPLTYRLPAGIEVRPGQRVLVPLGARKAIGIALEPVPGMAPGVRVRDVLRVLDTDSLLSPELLTLGFWMAEYYIAPVGEVLGAMLPVATETRHAQILTLTDRGKQQLEALRASLLEEIRGGEEAEFLAYLEAHADAAVETVRRKFPSSFQKLHSEAMKHDWARERGADREPRKVLAVRLSPSAAQEEEEVWQKLSPVRRRIIEALREHGALRDHRALLKSARASLATLNKLQREGLVDLAEARSATGWEGDHESSALGIGSMLRIPSAESLATPDVLTLTAGQASAADALAARMESREFSVSLLHGITGSGKTEIYLRLAAQCLADGRAALVLVPEISLTPMLQAQFERRFCAQVAVLHSGLSPASRREAWWRVWRGEARVVLGTRSAVFAPLARLGLVVVDEEHEASYKQEETPRYHGRDVAVVRARLAKALCVLGSATPSMESYWNAQQGKYRLLTLTQRVAGRPLASVEILDMRQEFRETHTQAPISRRLKQEIDAQIASGSQTMILLNHRGYAWFLLCRSCGEAITCVNCSISLTYHRREHRLICHYCGYTAPVPKRCPACGGEYLYYVGEGTEKLEDKLAEAFPGARVARLDRDTARRPGHYQRVLADFRDGKIDILAGTQLVAKGHDFPGVTLVGVISADMGLRLPDFRSAERTFQLLTQAAGRAGRGEAPGRVLVQTFYPAHYAILLAADQNYAGFFSKEMGFRRMMHFPPVTALANIVIQDKKLERAAEIGAEVGQILGQIADAKQMRIMGPHPAPLARLEGRCRIQILIRSNSRPLLNRVLRRVADECDLRRIPPRSVVMDVDPANIM
ncbi:MAG: replication restart helicase PriA [Terriglobia bacterium]